MENNQGRSVCISTSTVKEVEPAKTFHKFSKLPAELRRMVWKEFHTAYDEARAGRVVTLCFTPGTGFYSKLAPLPNFNVNCESRFEALQFFTPAFACHMKGDGDLASCISSNHKSIYLNFSKDIIYLQAVSGREVGSMLQAMSGADREMIQRLAINYVVPPRDNNLDTAERFLVDMPRLQQLFIVRISAWLTWERLAEAEVDHIFFKGYGVRCGVWQDNNIRHEFAARIRRPEHRQGWIVTAVCLISNYELLVLPAGLRRRKGTLDAPEGY